MLKEIVTMRLIHLFILCLVLSLSTVSCTNETTTQPQPSPNNTGGETKKPVDDTKDVHSFSHPDEVAVKNLDLDIAVNFDKKEISGKAALDIENKKNAKQLILDTNGLTIDKVTLGKDDKDAKTAKFVLGEEVKFEGGKISMGRPLTIDIEPDTKAVAVYYKTSPEATALQWLTPEQTAGGKKPFLFTQSEAILARSWIPCQDTPGVRMTYHAKVKVPNDLLAIMSAKNNPKKSADGVYEFEMKQAIPAYLMALAVGDIDYRELGKRSGVYAEPLVVPKAATEFVDIEKMILAAEKLYGPYRWERYDLIVLPPSFPFGGMENPRLTFATPTVIAGDKSLVSLVAHELAHSWSGNLVTNATWNDFWLNEGFTVYFERRIMEEISGKEYAEMLAQLGRQDLEDTVKDIMIDQKKPDDTRLHLNLINRDPDEGLTDIAYEKGYFFLRTVEEAVGREKFDAFLRKYFDTFAFQSMTTAKFIDYLNTNLIAGDKGLADKIQIDKWVNGPGIPENCPKIQSRQFDEVEAEVKSFEGGTAARELKTANWTTQHWLHFLRKLSRTTPKDKMVQLDEAFDFSKSGNSEILNEWLLLSIQTKYEPAYPALEKFLTSMGRRKFLKPLYTELAKTPEGTEMARKIYEKARPTYHPVSYQTIDDILKWNKDGTKPS